MDPWLHPVLHSMRAGVSGAHAHDTTRCNGCLWSLQEDTFEGPNCAHLTWRIYSLPYPISTEEVAVKPRNSSRDRSQGTWRRGRVNFVHTSRAKAVYDQRVAKRNATRSACDSKGERNITIDDISRFLATTRLPYFNPELRSTQTGLSCKGCQSALETGLKQVLSYAQHQALLDKRDRIFTEDMFLDHFTICMEAQRMWAEHYGTNGKV